MHAYTPTHLHTYTLTYSVLLPTNKTTQVNRALAEKFMKHDDKFLVDDDAADPKGTGNGDNAEYGSDSDNDIKSKKAKKAKTLQIDDRFKSLFHREEFEQDLQAPEFKLRVRGVEMVFLCLFLLYW